MIRPTIEKNALAGLVMSAVLTVVMVWAVAATLARLSQNTDQIIHSIEIIESVDSLIEHLADVETGERGYIITGDDVYLKPHEHGLMEVYGARDHLVRLLAGTTLEQSRLNELNKKLDLMIAVSRSNVQARKLGFEEARARVMEGVGRQEMEALRAILAEIFEVQAKRRDELRSRRDATMGELKRNMTIAAVLFIAILSYLYFRMIQMIKTIQEAVLQAQHLATHDALTGLPNRRLMLEHLNQAIQRCVRHKKGMALLFLDLNGFKPINDKHGHEAGDEALKQVAQRISGAVRASDMVARMGGDEFVVLAEDVGEREDVCDIVWKIGSEVGRPILLNALGEVDISTSIGVAIYPQDGKDVETLLRNADTAMYEAKRNHSKCYCKEDKQFSRCTNRDDGEGK